MKKDKLFTVRNMALMGVLSAMIFALTKFVSIPIPSPLGKTALQFGNVMCILASLLFGPAVGALSAGVGNALVDLSDPAWAPEFWVTFINKFAMAYVAGVIMHKVHLGSDKIRVWIAGTCGAVTYCALYVAKNIVWGHVVHGFEWNVAIVETLSLKLPVSLANGIIATVFAGVLYFAMVPALRRAHMLPGKQ